MTHITGRLVHADGVEAYGRCVISWPSFSIYGVSIAGGMMYLEITDGNLACDLYPCGAAVPPGMYYTARFELDSGAVYEEYWIVPDSPNVTLEQIRVAFPVAPGLAVSPTQITGMGAQPGMILSWNGSNWVGGWVQVSNVDPNYIRLEVGTAGTDFWIEGSPVMLGASARLNLPDASPTARGVVTTGPQTFGGDKTFVGTIDSPTIVALDARLDAIEATGAAVQSVFGRTGAVVALPGDYTVAQVTGAVPQTRQVIAGTGMTGGGPLSEDITLNADVLTVQGRTGNVVIDANDISVAGGVPATRRVIAGTGMTGGGPLSSDVVLNANVISVFGRTGSVVLQATDITAVGGVLDTRQILAGTGLTGGGDLSADRTLAVVDNQTIQKLEIAKGGVVIGTHKRLNFQEGSNITLNVADDIPNDRVNVTVTAVPIGGASPSNYWVNGGLIGTRPTLNLIQGANTIITGLDQTGGNRVDVTITAGAGAAVPTTRQVIAGTGLTGGGALSADVTLSVVPNTTLQKHEVAKNGTLIGTRKQINLIEGSNVVLTMFDSPGSDRVDVTIAGGISGVPATRQIIAGYGLTGGGDLSADRTLAQVDDTTIQKGRVSKAGTLIGTRREINFIEGANTTLTVADNTGSNRVDVTVASAAGGQNQTPWTQAIDGAGFALSNASSVSIKSTSQPAYSVQHGTTLAKSRLMMVVAGSRLDITSNLYYDGANWMRDDVALPGALYSHISGSHQFSTFAAGANPASPAYKLIANIDSAGIGVAGDCNISGVYKINNVPITGGAQTPWNQNVDANGYGLSKLRDLAIYGAPAVSHGTIGWYVSTKQRWFIGVNSDTPRMDFLRHDVNGNFVDTPLTLSETSGNIGIGLPTGGPRDRLSVIGGGSGNPGSASGRLQFSIGEGSNNPDYRLTLGYFADTEWKGVVQVWQGGAGGKLLLNPNAGNVGIGYAAYPQCILHVASGVDALPVLGEAKGNAYICGSGGSNLWGLLIGSLNTGNCWLQVQRTDTQAVAYNLLLNPVGGKVGIGTTAPGYTLDVAGAVQCTELRSTNYIYAGQHINTVADIRPEACSHVAAQFGSDNWIRWQTLSQFAANLPSVGQCIRMAGYATSNNWDVDFQNTPGLTRRWTEVSGGVGGPDSNWWFIENMRHSNGSNYWGRQIAWGWEGAANRMATRNWQSGVPGAWMEFVMNNGGTWGINITGGAGNANTLGGMAIQGDQAYPGASQILRSASDGWCWLGWTKMGSSPGAGTNVPNRIFGTHDDALRHYTLREMASHIYTQNVVSNNTLEIQCPTNINSVSGFVVGPGRGVSQYGALYYNATDSSINIYHSGFGFGIKMSAQGIYFVGVDGVQAQAGTGKIYKSGNTLMIS